jgi:hypothetical protein
MSSLLFSAFEACLAGLGMMRGTRSLHPMTFGMLTLRYVIFGSFCTYHRLIWPQAHSDDKKWCTQSFPLYDEILPLVEGRHATGELAWHIPEMHSSSVAGSDHGNDAEDNGEELQATDLADNEDLISNWSLSPSPPPAVELSTLLQSRMILIILSIRNSLLRHLCQLSKSGL